MVGRKIKRKIESGVSKSWFRLVQASRESSLRSPFSNHSTDLLTYQILKCHLTIMRKRKDGLLEGEWLNAHNCKLKFPTGESGRSKETLIYHTLLENSKRGHKVFYISKHVSRMHNHGTAHADVTVKAEHSRCG